MEPMRLQGGVRGEALWNLVLTPAKPLVLFGTNGVSRKAAEASAASHYLTWSRLQTEGELTLGGRVRKVRGLSWMDHEISSSQLGEGQVGWDWACLQLDDGREVMAYRMRRADGSTDPFSTLARVEADGTVHHVDPTGFRWTTEGTWKSPRSGGVYPAGVRLEIPGGPPNGGPYTVHRLRPLAADQELSGGAGGIPYWEGACEVLDDSGKRVGRAFLEMTGYAGDLGAALRPR
jgi:predicted secreted hydrolase